jgi:ribonuclease P protein component
MVFWFDNEQRPAVTSSLEDEQKDARSSQFSNMLPKKIRLTTALFDQVFKSGKVQHGLYFWSRSYDSDEAESRFAVTVPKKIAKTAVLRNKIKRLGYRGLEVAYGSDFSVQPVKKIVLGLKKDISNVPFDEIVKDLKNLLIEKKSKLS